MKQLTKGVLVFSNETCVCVCVFMCAYRFGSFEIFKPVDEDTGRRGPSVGRLDILHTMLDYTISTVYPQVSA
jgi:hypothetical protein